LFISAWGIAPGILVERISLALKAQFICAPDRFSRSVSQFVARVGREFANGVWGINSPAVLIRAFSVRFINIFRLGRCPRLKMSRAVGAKRIPEGFRGCPNRPSLPKNKSLSGLPH
jgi:hypothetical protein